MVSRYREVKQMMICNRWRDFVEKVESDPYGYVGYHASDYLFGWLDGYADFCEENGDRDHAEDIRWLIFVAIKRAEDIRRDDMAANRQRVIDAARGQQ